MSLIQHPGTSTVEVSVARSIEEVERLRAHWEAWPGHRDSDIDFYLTILQSYPEILGPHIITLRRNGNPAAIMVGRLEEKRLPFRIGYFTLLGRKARCLTFVYGAIHGDQTPETTEQLLRELTNSLRREADVALLEFVPIESPLYRLALRLPGILSPDTASPAQPHHVMEVPDSMDEVYRRMSSGRRIELRRRVRKLENHPAGTPRIVCYQDPCELDVLFRDTEVIARKTYQRGLGAGFADTRDVHLRLELAAKKGWLRAYILYLGDRPCAFWIGMLYGSTFVSEYMGYDPEFRQLSVGMVLIMRVIERFCNRGDGDLVKELDFGLGHAEYKSALCTKNWLEAAIYIFSPTPKGLLLKVMLTTTIVVDGLARRLLNSTHALPRLKRLWRDRLAKGGRHPAKDQGPAAATASAESASPLGQLTDSPRADEQAQPL